jgi:hypothetical protein
VMRGIRCRLLFSNVEEILLVNKYLLQELEDVFAKRTTKSLAELFMEISPFLQVQSAALRRGVREAGSCHSNICSTTPITMTLRRSCRS